jgi:hypothetical protein
MSISPVFVGSYRHGGSREFLPVSDAELLRCQHMIERTLQTFEFAHGRFVLLISFLDDGAYAIPFERAIMNLGLLATNADNSPYEALRIESICRRFDVAAVVGVTAEVLDGLEQAGHSLDAIFAGRVVWAFAGAHERLAGVSGITLRRMIVAGPAFGMECRAGAGVHFDSSEWSLDTRQGKITLTSRLLRALDFDSYETGLRGTLVPQPCPCGSNDVRVAFDRKTP